MQSCQRGFFRILLLLIIVLAGGAGVMAYEGNRRLGAAGPQDEETIVWIERGDTLGDVADKLVDEGIVGTGDATFFYYYGRAIGLAGELRSGEFVVPAGASIAEVTTILRTADPLLRFVTIPEGRTVAQAIALLSAAPKLAGQVTVKPAEGTLLPEPYAYERGEKRDLVMGRMIEAHDALMAELWPARASGLPFDTPEEAVILASIVEKETAVADERPRVAAVFVNRLRKRMRLQSDPTIIYGR